MDGVDFTVLVQALVAASAAIITTLAAIAVQVLRTRFRLEAESLARKDVAESMCDHATALRASGTEPTPALLAEMVNGQMPDTVRILRTSPEKLATKAAAMIAKTEGADG